MLMFHLFILAFVQGITEFLPISSSGHLVLLHHFFDEGTAQENLLLDIAVHVGTLLAVLLYFRADVYTLFSGLFKIAKGQRTDFESRLVGYIMIGSIPVIVCGFLITLYDADWLRSPYVIAWTTLIFGILLGLADRLKPQALSLHDMNWRAALFIGLSQALALIPGTSRSGITMTAGRWLGFTRVEAARFSLLLSIVAISGAGFIGGIGLLKMGNMSFTLDIFLAAALAFVSALVAIAIMMRWLERASFTPFVIYRIVLGGGLLALLYYPY